MNVVITGGAGFLGARLARTLLEAGTIVIDGQVAEPLGQLTLVDLMPPPSFLADDDRVRVVTGDLATLLADSSRSFGSVAPAAAEDLFAGVDAVFHLASAVSADCEADFDLGIQANLVGGYALLQALRQVGARPVFVFASSLAVFGQSPRQPLPDVVTDTTLPTPMTSYGTQKFMLEQLVADCTRKGFIRGRNVRLMTVSVRPGRPNGAASGFLSGIIREPLAGVRAVCPVAPTTAVALSSPARTIEGLLRAAAVDESDWGSRAALNLPSVSTTVAEMVQALADVAGAEVAERIDWVPDPAIETILASWPARFATDRAGRLGLRPDPDFASVIRAYQQESTYSGGRDQPAGERRSATSPG